MFERMYKDEPGNWQEVTEEEVRYRFADWYKDVDLAIDTIKIGYVPELDTPFAVFRYTEKESQ